MSERLFRRGGVWYCWYYDRAGHQRKESTKCTSKRAALSVLREKEEVARGARPVAGPAYTVGEALQAFLERGTGQIAAGTKKMYRVRARSLGEELGDTDVNAITRQNLEEYISRREEKVGSHTIYKEIVTLRRALQFADDEGRLLINWQRTIPRRKSGYVPRDRWMTEDEFRRLLVALPSARRLWLMTAVFTGGREQEVAGLRWEDIDFRQGWVLLNGTKTDRSRRHIPLAEALEQNLDSDGKKGSVLEPWANVCRDLKRACQKAEIPPVTPNDCRRTFASWMLQRGATVKEVADLLGHASTTMVERIYGHLAADNLKSAVGRLPAGRGWDNCGIKTGRWKLSVAHTRDKKKGLPSRKGPLGH